MKPIKSFVRSFSVFALLFASMGQAAPTQGKENPSATLTRAAQVQELKASLSKDIYRQEAYESPYEVQVPYQVEVPYTDYETEYVQEYVCHDRVDQNYQCRSEYQCHDVPEAPNCSYETVCREVGGGRSCQQECFDSERPGVGRVCRDVCTAVPGQQQCDQVQRCTGGGTCRECQTEQRCGYEPVVRQECGYENVARQRPVTRTRTETHYRTETRCCETRYRSVFDYRAELNVVILIPQEAVLEDTEKEVFKVQMKSATEVSIDTAQTLYGYKVADRNLSGSNLTLKLALAPKYTAAELGEKTVSGLAMSIKDGLAKIAFADTGLRAKVKTTYKVSVANKVTGEVLESVDAVSNGKKDVSISLSRRYPTNVEYAVTVTVKREGLPLDQAVSFAKTFTRSKDPLKRELFDGRVVAVPKVSGRLRQAKVVFKDGAPKTDEVTTTYKLKVTVRSGFLNLGRKVIVEKAVSPSAFTRSPAGIVEISLSKLGVAAEDLDRLHQSATAWIDVTVTRKGARLNGGKPLVITRSSETAVP